MVFAPVALLGFDDASRKVRLGLAAAQQDVAGVAAPVPTPFAKAYAETIVMARLHQAHFRRQTLDAYRNRCCICELQERPLLDAAHILADRLPEGVATVRNGLAMCPTHHRAFDRDIVLVTEDYKVEVRRDRLEHADAEATQRMILDFHGRPIRLPKEERFWPDSALLRGRMEAAA
jgi:putative restriction endonuclease